VEKISVVFEARRGAAYELLVDREIEAADWCAAWAAAEAEALALAQREGVDVRVREAEKGGAASIAEPPDGDLPARIVGSR